MTGMNILVGRSYANNLKCRKAFENCHFSTHFANLEVFTAPKHEAEVDKTNDVYRKYRFQTFKI